MYVYESVCNTVTLNNVFVGILHNTSILLRVSRKVPSNPTFFLLFLKEFNN